MLNAIANEIILRKKELQTEKIETIYFGGGTPSILKTEEINTIIRLISKNSTISSNAEITLEANPDDLSLKKIKELKQTAINRLSIGIQSFFEEDLAFMNRAHSEKQAKKSLETALKYFENITIDLIYGVPNMTADRWKKNLQIAFNLNVPHISSYALTVEEKTALNSFIKKGKIKPLDENLALEHFSILVSETQKRGYIQYEISNFGKPHFFSKHNTSYWLNKKYIGIGPSAHSYNGTVRIWNVKNNIKYIKSIIKNELTQEIETLSLTDKYNEYIMTGLRTIWGVSLRKININFGKDFKQYLLKAAQKHINKELLTLNNHHLTVTEKGKFLTDGIIADLFKV